MNEIEAVPQLRVLVVEDEAGLCELACIWVESLGFDVVGVDSPDQALAQLAAERFDVLFSDVMMPGSMDGVALAHEAKRRHPGLRVVLTSGHPQRLLDDPNVPGEALGKPYSKAELAEAIQRTGTGNRAA